MSKQLYYETVRGGLVKVKNPHLVRSAGCDETRLRWEVEVVADHVPYRKGEVIVTSHLHLVHKAGYRQHFQMVTQAELP
jgi:hypothetical protein